MLSSDNIYVKVVLEAIKPPGGMSLDDAVKAVGKSVGVASKDMASFTKGLKTEVVAVLDATAKAAEAAGEKLKEGFVGPATEGLKGVRAEAEKAGKGLKECMIGAVPPDMKDKLKSIRDEWEKTHGAIKDTGPASLATAEDLKKIGVGADEAGDKMHTMGLRGYFALSRLQYGLEQVRNVFAGAMKTIVSMAAEASDRIHQAEMDAARVGMAGSPFEKLQYAMERMGAEPGTMRTALERFSQQIEHATSGSKAAVENFAKLGVSFTDAGGNARPMLDILMDVADALARIADPKLAEGITKNLFGRGGGNIFTILRQGRYALQAMMSEGEAVGVGFAQQDLERATEFHRTLLDVKTSWRELKESLAVAVMPWLSEKLDMVKEWINSIRDWTDEHQALTGALAEMALAFTAVATAITSIGVFGLGVIIALKALAVAAAEISATGGLFALAGGTAAVGGAVTAGAGAGAGAAATGAAGGLGLGAALGGAVALLTNPYIIAAAASAAMFWVMYQETVGEALNEYKAKKDTEYGAVLAGMERGRYPYREEVGGWIRPEMVRGYRPSAALKEMTREQQEGGGWGKRTWMPEAFYKWIEDQGFTRGQFHEMTPIEQERMTLGYAKASQGLQGQAWMATQLNMTRFKQLTAQQVGWIQAQPLPPQWASPESGGWGYGWEQPWTKTPEVEQWRQYYGGQMGGAAAAGGDPLQAYMKWQRGVALSEQEKKQVANLINTRQMQLRQGGQAGWAAQGLRGTDWYQEQLAGLAERRAQTTYQWQQFMAQVPEVDRPYYRQYQQAQMYQIGEEQRELQRQQGRERTWVQGQLRLLNSKEAELEGTLYYGGGEFAPGW